MSDPNKITIAASIVSITVNDYISQKDTLEEVNFAQNSQLTTIAESAFQGFTALRCFSLETCNKIKEIPKYCFLKCTSLKTVILPKDGILETLNSASFSFTAIKTLKLPPSVKNIMAETSDKGVFYSTYSFEKLEFYSTNGIEIIQSYAFTATQVTEIDIGPNLRQLDGTAFESVDRSFVKISSSGTNNNFCIVDNILYNKEKTKLICCPHGYTPSSICSTVKIIGVEAFHRSAIKHVNFLHNGITSIELYCFCRIYAETITLPETILLIGIYAFKGCSKLKSIIIPPISSIAEGVFYDCKKLRTVVISNGTMKICDVAFYNCKAVKEIYIPSSVIDVSTSAFSCSSITKCGVRCPFDKRSAILKWSGFSNSSFEQCFEAKTIKFNCISSSFASPYIIVMIVSCGNI